MYMCLTEDFGVNGPTTASPHALKGDNATVGWSAPEIRERS